jgi:hypothetical protein
MAHLITQVDIPQYITRVKIANARRPRYYEKGSSKKIPKKYSNKKNFDFIPVKVGKRICYYLADLSDNSPVLANPKVAGKPKMMKIRGNDFYSGFGNPAMRSNVVNLIKEGLSPYFKDMDPIKAADYPLYLEFTYYDTIEESQDLDNKRYAYEKCILDLLQKEGRIVNDNVKYIVKLSSEFVAVESEEDRCLVVKFWCHEKVEDEREKE